MGGFLGCEKRATTVMGESGVVGLDVFVKAGGEILGPSCLGR